MPSINSTFAVWSGADQSLIMANGSNKEGGHSRGAFAEILFDWFWNANDTQILKNERNLKGCFLSEIMEWSSNTVFTAADYLKKRFVEP